MAYKSYQDIRGDLAKDISAAMGIDEPSGIAHTGYLVEVRKANDHIRLSAHAATYFTEVLLNHNHSLEVIEIDRLKDEATKIVYSPDQGTITTLKAPWKYAANGYTGPYREVGKLTGQSERALMEWERYDQILMKAEPLLR